MFDSARLQLPEQQAPIQPTIYYMFLDLDALLSSVQTHMLAQPTVFPKELTQVSKDGVLLLPERLMALLDGQQHQEHQPPLVLCRYGSYFNRSLENARAFQAAGWNLRKKGEIDHRTLENLMEKTLEQVGICSSQSSPKTMVLATGELRPPAQSCVRAYLKSGWRVKLLCLQRCWRQILDDLGNIYQKRLDVMYIDQHIRGMVANNSSVFGSASAPRGPTLLSQIATNEALWNKVSVRRSNEPLNTRALKFAASLGLHPNRTNDDRSRKQEQLAATRRSNLLSMLPKASPAGHHERYVFLNLDNIAGALFTSHELYRHIDGAAGPHDIRLDFGALTQHLCGVDNSSAVKCQLAAYCKTSPFLARALTDFGWTLLKSQAVTGGDNNGLTCEMIAKLIDGASTNNERTLVLAMGDGGLGSTNRSAYREIIGKFLEHGWHVEVFAWLHALNDGFIDLQVQNPGRVVVKPLDENVVQLAYPKNREDATALNTINQRRTLSMAYAAPQRRLPPSLPPQQPLVAALEQESQDMETAFAAPHQLKLPSLSPPEPTVTALQHQIEQMQAQFASLQTRLTMQQQLQQQIEELEKNMREQANIFEEERQQQAALAKQQASDARLARRLQLEEREESLTCPITCELYKDPRTTVCCGKTFSAEVVSRLDECPWCRQHNLSTHPNRDVASLVELYRAERDELDAEEYNAEDGDEQSDEDDKDE
ncbi:unnamed protein product [Phytophthora lilii]|uniref:Unnamed protein product n=1 Tax=Phytophthora lilii TaxID=2077276 RepID=A0A9W6U8J5_9STRA|nr:unnamed protein product [Phytophthora lilii]